MWSQAPPKTMPSHNLLGENNATCICTCTVHASTCSTHWHNIGTDIIRGYITGQHGRYRRTCTCILYAGFISGFHSRGGQTHSGKLQLWVNANPGGQPHIKDRESHSLPVLGCRSCPHWHPCLPYQESSSERGCGSKGGNRERGRGKKIHNLI